MKTLLMPLAIGATLSMSAQNTMSPELLWKLGRVGLEDVSADGNKILYGVTRYDIESNGSERDLYVLDITTGERTLAIDLPGSESSAVFFDGNRIGYAKGGQYWITEIGGTPMALTILPEGAGNFKPVQLKNGNWQLLFSINEKVENPLVEPYKSLEKADFKVMDDLMYRHWNEWTDDQYSKPCFGELDLSGEKILGGKSMSFTILMEGNRFESPIPPFGGSESFAMSPDGRYFVYNAKRFTGKDFATSTNSALYLYDTETMKETEIPGGEGYDSHPAFSEDGQFLAFLSMARDGYESDENRLAIYDIEKGTTKIVGGADDENLEYIYDFQWTGRQGIHVLIPTRATQQIARLTLGKEDDAGRISYDKEWLTEGDYNYMGFHVHEGRVIAERQDINHATEIFKIESRTAEALTHVNDEIYSNIELSRVEKRMIPTSDGKEMLTWVIYPPNFDESKRYPTILYCQGGPQSPVSQFYSYRWNFQLMAAEGYIVVAPNRRGVPGFGSEWNEAISEDWGGQPMRDYLAAIDHISAEPYSDENRLGAVGASYGGYSVYMLAGIHEGRFKAFISHCGLFNMESWYGSTEELFFANWDLGGAYWEQPAPQTYAKYSPHRYVQNWDTPILVIHGGKDFRVPENQGMEAFQAAQLREIPSKFLYFPNEGHWVLQPQNGVVWQNEFFGWLQRWLK